MSANAAAGFGLSGRRRRRWIRWRRGARRRGPAGRRKCRVARATFVKTRGNFCKRPVRYRRRTPEEILPAAEYLFKSPNFK